MNSHSYLRTASFAIGCIENGIDHPQSGAVRISVVMPRCFGRWIACLLAVAWGATDACAQAACNGLPELCDRPYDEVAYLTTHNAYSTSADGFTTPLPNQQLSMSRQLADGVRGLMLDTYEHNGRGFLCHGACGPWGQRPLVDGLEEIRVFLDDHPNEVVTLIIEAYLSESMTEADFVESGLIDYVYPHVPGDPWPTLGEMIDWGTRLVVLTDDPAVTLDWHLYVWEYAWETPFSFGQISDFTCEENRGTPPDDLFILNHFLTGPLGGVRRKASSVNDFWLLYARAVECWGYEPTNPDSGLPSFVTVDHYDLGNPLGVVVALNQRWPVPPLYLEKSDIVAGDPVELVARGAAPGETVHFLRSMAGRGDGPCPPELGELCVDLLPPVSLVGSAVADPSGIARWDGVVPAGAPAIPVSTQAVVRRGVDGSESDESVARQVTIGP